MSLQSSNVSHWLVWCGKEHHVHTAGTGATEPGTQGEDREQSRYAPSQWETSLQCSNISHWLVWCGQEHHVHTAGTGATEPGTHGEDRDQSRYVPSQWGMSLQCNDISHWLGAYLDWYLWGGVDRWLWKNMTQPDCGMSRMLAMQPIQSSLNSLVQNQIW